MDGLWIGKDLKVNNRDLLLTFPWGTEENRDKP
jgi:hypothetical protein